MADNNSGNPSGRFAGRLKPTSGGPAKMDDVELGAAGGSTAAASATRPTFAPAGQTPATSKPGYSPSASTASAASTGYTPAGNQQGYAPVGPIGTAKPMQSNVAYPRVPPPPPPSASVSTGPLLAQGGSDGGIPNEPQDEPEDEDPQEPEETKYEKRSINKMPKFFSLIIDLVLAVLMLFPWFITYLTRDYPKYNILEVKGPVDALNPFMEFFRWSLFIAIAFFAYSMIDFILGALPTHILTIFNKLGLFKSKRAKRQVGYLRNIHPYLTACVYFIFLLWLGGFIVYSSNPAGAALRVGPLGGPAPTPTTGGAAGATTVTVEPIQDMRYYIERFLILAAILAGVVAFEKYLLEAIRAKFHRMALAVRIKDINYRQAVIKILDSKISSGQPHIAASRRPGLAPGSEDIYLEIDQQLGMTSLARARSIASKIFAGLKVAGRDYLIKEDLAKYFATAELDAAFTVIDVNRNGEVDEAELTEVCEDLFEDIQNIRASLIGNARIVGKLDRLMLIVAILLGLALAMPFFDVGLGKAWATFGVISTAFGFMFQNAGKICFESLIFVFVEHAFDVGDRVTVDGENMVVQNIEIFTTRFVRWDGQIVYAPNAVLSGKYIFNVRRSGMQSEQIIAQISAQTTTDQLRQVLVQLKEKTLEETKDFTGFVDIVEFSVLDEKKMEVKFTVQYKSNFQHQAQRNARKTKFNMLMKEVLAEQDIEYFPSG